MRVVVKKTVMQPVEVEESVIIKTDAELRELLSPFASRLYPEQLDAVISVIRGENPDMYDVYTPYAVNRLITLSALVESAKKVLEGS